MRIRELAATAALATTMTMGAVATAAGTEVIEPAVTGDVGPFFPSMAQSFTPTTDGTVREVTVWAQTATPGRRSELLLHDGVRPGDEIGRTTFTWAGNPTTVVLDIPLAVSAGQPYTLQLVGAMADVVFGAPDDPYPGGEVMIGSSSGGWRTWTEWLADCGGCLSGFVVDQRFSLEVVPVDADGDGVLDDDDRCDGTVLPDPSWSTLGRSRYAATRGGIVGVDGVVLASLSEVGGCSTAQIIEILELGNGHLKFGLTRPHVERWIADVAGA